MGDSARWPSTWLCRVTRLLVVGGMAFVPMRFDPLLAAPVNATFQIQQQSSNLGVTVRRGIFSDSDTKPLAGTVDITFDFGSSGALPTTANVTVTGADVRAVGAYNFELAFSTVDITASGLVANVDTPTPPATMTKPAGPGTTYQFDAAQFRLTMVEGIIVVTGLFNETVDLSQEDPPIAGASPPGTFGTLALTPGASVGPYTLFNATVNLPIAIDETIMFGDPPDTQEVDLSLRSTVVATSSFYAALAPIPGDFNQDGSVTNADYPLWTAGFGMAGGATVSQGDANGDGDADGDDFLAWQANLGTAPPAVPGVSALSAVPEPSGAELAASTAILLLGALRMSARSSAPAAALVRSRR